MMHASTQARGRRVSRSDRYDAISLAFCDFSRPGRFTAWPTHPSQIEHRSTPTRCSRRKLLQLPARQYGLPRPVARAIHERRLTVERIQIAHFLPTRLRMTVVNPTADTGVVSECSFTIGRQQAEEPVFLVVIVRTTSQFDVRHRLSRHRPRMGGHGGTPGSRVPGSGRWFRRRRTGPLSRDHTARLTVAGT